MTKPWYRAIILVLASSNDVLYDYFKKVYLAYKDCNPYIKVFFVYGSGTTFERQEHDLVYDWVKESVTPPYPSTKVINALEYIDNNYNYDYLIRTNLSTFWDFNSLLTRLDTLPSKRCLSGRIGYIPPEFVVGTGMIISSDLIPEIIEQRDVVNVKYPKYVAEDRILSEFFTNKLGVTIIKADDKIHNIEKLTSDDKDTILREIQKGIALNKDHYRIKNMSDRMKIDTAVAKTLCELFYNKVVN